MPTITINVADIAVEELESIIVNTIVDRVVGDRYGTMDAINGVVAKALTAKIEERVDAIINAQLEAGVQRTDSFGDPVGAPTTLRGMVIEHAKSWLDDKVDQHGDKRQYGQETRGKQLVSKYVGDAMSGALRKEVDTVIDDVRKGLRERVSARITEVVAELLRRP